ncbi:hypothetical protein GQ43DRAFT_443848 [Delitschia confertaspora ATCC 74209]|uniref:Biotrophy-associated secreted protein 2 n=1 Tax=Delitschia confertaspora ATCC 74209 TaxID=1513339 RepID=A0A9P4JJX8_9PLEO|nr:hypothetical protein GQ43DRAFT_443848 [Delitschia confertaspora ATCC 74209]
MAPFFKTFALLNFALLGAVQGKQFITGDCLSDAECEQGCCAFNTGKCAGPIIAQERDGGCGFGDAQPNANAAIALGFNGLAGGGNTAAPPAQAPSAETNNRAGTQFITQPCTSDTDCGSGCCGFTTGKCAGAIIAQERDGGCGFGNAKPNDDAAQKLRGSRLGKRGVVYWM